MKILIVDRRDDLSSDQQRFVERRLRFALTRFDSRIKSTRIVLEDMNGPRGGVDKSCQITVALLRARDIVIKDQDADLVRCVARAADRASRAVARAIERTQSNRRSQLLADGSIWRQ